jgi:hypothetical protein
MQSDGTGVGRRAAVPVDEVLRHTSPQIVPDADVGDVASILAAIHRVDRRHTRELPNRRYDAHAARMRAPENGPLQQVELDPAVVLREGD